MGVPGWTDSGVSIPMYRTLRSRPLISMWMVSPSVVFVTWASWSPGGTRRDPGLALGIPVGRLGRLLGLSSVTEGWHDWRRARSAGDRAHAGDDRGRQEATPVLRIDRRLGVLVVIGTLLIAGPVQAAAPPPPRDTVTGRTGIHRLPDSEAAPAGRCRYGYVVEGEGYYNGIHGIRVIAPVAYARAGKASQRLAARLVIQYWRDDAWHTYAASSWQARTATPTRKADFGARSMTVDSRPLHNVVDTWRARVDIRWFGGDGTVKGTARLYPGDYAGSEGPTQLPVQHDLCGSTTG
jgi:hypothetical protein